MQIEYLSEEWLNEAAKALSTVVVDPPIEGPALALDTIVTTDGEPIRYRFRFERSGVALERPGETATDDGTAVVRFTQTREVAVAIAKGERSAQEAFLASDIQLGGDVTRLIQLSGLLQQVGDVLAPLRDRTSF